MVEMTLKYLIIRYLTFILLAMDNNNLTVRIFIRKIMGHLLGAVDRAVLTTCAAEGDLEAGEVAFHIFLHTLSYDGFDMVEELVDGGFLLQELDDRTVLARIGLVLGVAAGVGQRTAIEDESAAIAGGVGGEASLVTETADSDNQGVLGSARECWGVLGQYH